MTAGFAEFCTAGVNGWDWPGYKVALVGVIDTEIGGERVMVAIPDPLGVATLLAVTVTV